MSIADTDTRHGREAELTSRIDQLERELAEAREKLAAKPVVDRAQLFAITDTLPMAVAVIGRDHRYEFANSVHRTWLGLENERVAGRAVDDVVGADVYQLLVGALDQAFAGERAVIETSLPDRHGGARRSYITCTPRRAPSGDVTGAIMLIVDLNRSSADQAALLEVETDYHAAVELNPHVVWAARPDGQLDRVSRRWFEWTGTSGLGSTWAEGLHVDDRARTFEVWGRSVSTGEPYDIEHRVKMLDGTYRWCHSRAYARRDEAGGIVRWYGATEDIHDRKVAEDAVRASEERLRLATEGAGMGTWDFDLIEGRGVWSDSAFRTLGYTPAPDGVWTLDMWVDRVISEDRVQARAAAAAAKRDRVSYSSEYRIHRADDGAERWIQAFGHYVYDETGAAVRYIGVFFDVTDRKHAEAALRASSERFQAAVRAVQGVLWTNDAEGRMTGEQPGWAALTGQSREEYEGYGWAKAVHPDDAQPTVDAWNEAVAERKTFLFAHRLRRHDGQWRRFSVRAVPAIDADGVIREWVGVHTDITEEERAKAELAEESRTLETLNRTGEAVAAELDLSRIVQTVTEAGVELTGAAYGVFFYNVLNEAGERDMLRALAGVDGSAFADFAMPQATEVFASTFRGEGVVRLDDVTLDTRYDRSQLQSGRPEGHLSVRSYLTIPVVSRSGDVIGALFFGHPESGRFDARHERLMAGLAAQTAIALDNASLYQASQRELAERGLAEARLRDLLATVDLGNLMARDLDGTIRFWSAGLERLYGWTAEEAKGRNAHGLLGTTFSVPKAGVDAALEREGEWAGDLRQRTKDGRELVVAARKVLRRDADGRPTAVLEALTDVTSQRLAEAALRESEARFRLIADSAPMPMWVTRLDRRREFVNRAYVDFLGISYEEAIDFDWRHVIHPDDIERIYKEQVEKEASLQPFTLEARYKNAHGYWRWLRSESQPRWGPKGEHIGFIGAAYDITIAKKAERRLAKLVADRTAERDAVWRTSRDLILVIRASDAVFVNVNPAWTTELGYREEELVGLGLEALSHPDDLPAMRVNWAKVVGGEPITDIEIRLRGPDGSYRPFTWNARREGDHVFAFGRDLTVRKDLEEQLRQAQKMEAVGQLTGGVAHDFNNLLTPVMGSLDILRRRLTSDERAQRTVDIALQATSRAATLVQRLLAFARRQDLQARSVDVADLLGGMEDLIDRSLGSAVQVTIDAPAGLPPAHVDPNQLELAILNLSINARDAMPAGGTLTITAREGEVKRAAPDLKPGRYVRIAVADTGVGMDETTLKRAVEPFFSTKGVGKGTGLGLSMVHGLAAQLGGALRLSSAPGVGTTAELWLPIADAPAKETITPADTSTQAERAATILLVDDEDLVRAGATEMLVDLGYQVVEASSGAEALQALEGGLVPDMMVSDYLMAGMNGAELAAEVRRRLPTLPVLLISGYTNLAGAAAGLPQLTKPFRQEELSTAVAALLKADQVGG